jgi:hypothetical protein
MIFLFANTTTPSLGLHPACFWVPIEIDRETRKEEEIRERNKRTN